MTNAAIIVSHRSPDDLCALANAYRTHGFKVIIVENSADALRPACDVDAYLSGHGNVGYGCALNLGYIHARREFGPLEWVLLSNADATPSSRLLSAVARGELPPGLDIVGFADSSNEPWRRLMPSARATIAAIRGVDTRLVDELPLDRTYPVGAILAVRGDTFEALEGFDPGYFLYFEEVDLIDRATRSGIAWGFAPPELTYAHDAHSSTNQVSRAAQFELGRSGAIYFRRRGVVRLAPWVVAELCRLALLGLRASWRRTWRADDGPATLHGMVLGLILPARADARSRQLFARPDGTATMRPARTDSAQG